MKGDDSEHLPNTLKSEPIEVYLRFGGGALADIFTYRYKDMKSNKASKQKEKKELQVLECIRRVDKSTLPPALAYRDRGGMYFPDEAFIPFIRSLDDCVREIQMQTALHVMAKISSRLQLSRYSKIKYYSNNSKTFFM